MHQENLIFFLRKVHTTYQRLSALNIWKFNVDIDTSIKTLIAIFLYNMDFCEAVKNFKTLWTGLSSPTIPFLSFHKINIKVQVLKIEVLFIKIKFTDFMVSLMWFNKHVPLHRHIQINKEAFPSCQKVPLCPCPVNALPADCTPEATTICA